MNEYLKNFKEQVDDSIFHPTTRDEKTNEIKPLRWRGDGSSVQSKLEEAGKVESNDEEDIVMHRSLICSSAFLIKDWIIDVRKKFDPASGELRLSLA